MRGLWTCAALVLVSTARLSAETAEADITLPSPEQHAHKGFLVGEYDPSKPTVTVFKDPLCGYCIAAMPRLDRLAEYNVYLFWAPMFGQRSEFSIAEIFRCASPAERRVRHLIAERQQPGCSGQVDKAALAVNDRMVDAYGVKSVPAYYFQGSRVSLDELLFRQLEHPPVAGVAVDWDRYADARIRKRPESHSIALILNARDVDRIMLLDEEYRPQFVFAETDPGTKKSYAEVRLLLDLGDRKESSFLLSRDGRIFEL